MEKIFLTKMVWPGRPATKKNSQRMIVYQGRHIPIPSAAYKNYEEGVGPICMNAARHQSVSIPYKMPYDIPMMAEIKYYMPDMRWFPDLIGLLQATGDILEAHEVISNDRYLASFSGSEIAGIDANYPRTEITLYALEGHQYENIEPKLFKLKNGAKKKRKKEE